MNCEFFTHEITNLNKITHVFGLIANYFPPNIYLNDYSLLTEPNGTFNDDKV